MIDTPTQLAIVATLPTQPGEQITVVVIRGTERVDARLTMTGDGAPVRVIVEAVSDG